MDVWGVPEGLSATQAKCTGGIRLDNLRVRTAFHLIAHSATMQGSIRESVSTAFFIGPQLLSIVKRGLPDELPLLYEDCITRFADRMNNRTDYEQLGEMLKSLKGTGDIERLNTLVDAIREQPFQLQGGFRTTFPQLPELLVEFEIAPDIG